MKDANGLYYYPFPRNKRVRMYVRPPIDKIRDDKIRVDETGGDEIEFRLWNQDDPGLWMEHGWVPYTAIDQARAMYKGGPFDPNKAYDLSLAKALIADDR